MKCLNLTVPGAILGAVTASDGKRTVVNNHYHKGKERHRYRHGDDHKGKERHRYRHGDDHQGKKKHRHRYDD